MLLGLRCPCVLISGLSCKHWQRRALLVAPTDTNVRAQPPPIRHLSRRFHPFTPNPSEPLGERSVVEETDLMPAGGAIASWTRALPRWAQGAHRSSPGGDRGDGPPRPSRCSPNSVRIQGFTTRSTPVTRVRHSRPYGIVTLYGPAMTTGEDIRTRIGLPFDDSGETMRQAIEQAGVPALLMSMVHITPGRRHRLSRGRSAGRHQTQTGRLPLHHRREAGRPVTTSAPIAGSAYR